MFSQEVQTFILLALFLIPVLDSPKTCSNKGPAHKLSGLIVSWERVQNCRLDHNLHKITCKLTLVHTPKHTQACSRSHTLTHIHVHAHTLWMKKEHTGRGWVVPAFTPGRSL